MDSVVISPDNINYSLVHLNNDSNHPSGASSCARASTMTIIFYFSAIIIFVLVACSVFYTSLLWTHPEPDECELETERFFLRQNIIALENDTADYKHCSETLPLFDQCGHPLTDSYVFRRQKRVIGGSAVYNRSYYPWMVSILFDEIKVNGTYRERESKHNCGATVISKRYLLTAAHCVKCNRVREIELRNGTRVKVEETIPHPNYVRNCSQKVHTTRENDIALVRLQVEIDVEPVCLPLLRCYGLEKTDVTPQKGIVAGYGYTRPDATEASEHLHHALLDRNSTGRCADIYNMNQRESTICTATPGKDFCKGDSGGPLFTSVNNRSVQVGIASFGSSNCNDGSPSVFTKVIYYMSWIKDETSSECDSQS